MRALVISGSGQENEPHPGLKEFAENYLRPRGYTVEYTSYADKNFSLDGVVLAVGHSFGAYELFLRLQNHTAPIKAIFWDTVHYDWDSENIKVNDNVKGLSVIKDYKWWQFWVYYPPCTDVKGPFMTTMRYKLGHNSIVNDDDVQRDVAARIL